MLIQIASCHVIMDGFSPLCYNCAMMRKAVAIMLILVLALACGCKSEPQQVVDVLGSESTQADATSSDSAAQGSVTGATVSVVDTVAYVFDCAEGVTLYGAVEYQNTGDVPVRITQASFSFTAGGQFIPQQFTPILSEYDIVQPGQSSYIAMWFKDDTLSAGASCELEAGLTCEASSVERNDIAVTDLFLADNYPGFTTLSGSIRSTSSETCSLNMIYVGFYGSDGGLLGVWHFTRNAQLEPGDEKAFVVNMTELPISGLAELASEARGTGFGFN